eukprot:TRINITY_DN15621_c0_g1_i1.p1 TRINITY_DN15621_c0_g1~~TRINITY_DN15621_c0_g1_i1.p1  ORF type:complete len:153 (-),score=36.14 TRINITY_DN15621_c0_g1_i1:465-923(-)
MDSYQMYKDDLKKRYASSEYSNYDSPSESGSDSEDEVSYDISPHKQHLSLYLKSDKKEDIPVLTEVLLKQLAQDQIGVWDESKGILRMQDNSPIIIFSDDDDDPEIYEEIIEDNIPNHNLTNGVHNEYKNSKNNTDGTSNRSESKLKNETER